MSELFTQNLFTQNNGSGGGTGGAVDSVNGKTGTVVLTGNDLSVSSTNATKVATAVTENGNAIVGLSSDLNNLSQVVEGKQDKLTAGEGISIEGTTISSTSQIPGNVYTEDNLIAGDNVTITEVLPEGGIDENTLACWHFDGDLKDAVTGLVALMGNYDTSNKKFGTGAYHTSSASSETNISSLGLNPLTKSATIDFWFKCITDAEECRIGFGTYSESNLAINIKQDSLTLIGKNWGSAKVTNVVVPGLDFNHYAIQFNKETNKASVFFNGKKVAEHTPSELSSSSFSNFVAYSYKRKNAVDELRISDIARYNEDFTPPTKPYELAIPTGKKQINAIIPEIDLSGYIPSVQKGVANGVASLDANTKVPSAQIPVATASTLGGVKPDGTTITVTEDGIISAVTPSIDVPSDVYTQSNLLAGKGIEIIDEPVEGGIDNHTLACLHFDGDTNNAAGDNLKLNYPNSWESTTSNPKFGSGKLDTSAVLDISKYNLTDKTSFTLDFWLDKPESSPEIYFGLASGTGGWGYAPTRETTFIVWYNFAVHNKLRVKNSTGEKIVDVPAIENWNTGTYKHFALTYDGTEGKASFFIDGVLKTSVTFESTVNKNLTSLYIYSSDEVRLSDIVRYTENFVPPTKPYSLAVPTGNKVVNNTITKTSQLTNDSGFITDVPVATTTVAGKMKPDGTSIAINETGTISTVNTVHSTAITTIVKLTQAEYDALTTKDENTLYYIVEG